MFKNQSVIYSPYGAYELKATYQRNMLVSCMLVNGLAALLMISVALFVNSSPSETKKLLPSPREIITEILPTPATPTPHPPSIRPPKPQKPAVGVMVPVDDEEFIEIETEIISIDPFTNSTDLDNDTSNGQNYNYDYQDGIGDMPGVTSFVPNVQIPQFIHKAQPEYPRMEKTAGIEGTVWIAVHVDITGEVIEAKVYNSSGRDSFDQAALSAAFKNKFRPAIQNGHPVKLWTAYKVEFVLNQ
jgi:protein TonB